MKECSIVVSHNATEFDRLIANELKMAIETMEKSTDIHADNVEKTTNELLLGETNRSESIDFANECKKAQADCGYGVRNGRVVLYGRYPEALHTAVKKMMSDISGKTEFETVNEAATPVLTEGATFMYQSEKRIVRLDGQPLQNSLRTSRLWGVNGHNKGHLPYTEANTEKIIKLAAEMGSTIYRINYNPRNEEMLTYINAVIDLIHAYGMQVMLVLDDMYGTVDEIEKRVTYIGQHLADKVEFFQIFNETDIWASFKDDGSFYNISNWTGMTTEYYNPERVKVCVEKVGAAIQAFRAVAPKAKIVINIGSRHFPILDWYIDAGISWDIIAIDQYDLTTWDNTAFLREMEKRYPTYDFMVAEFNYPANSGEYDESEQARWLKTFFREMSDYDSNRFLGVIAYELMDERFIQKDEKWSGEAHFGLVHTDETHSPATKKEGYLTLQQMLCGGECRAVTVLHRL